MRWIIIILLGMGMVLTGCSNKGNVIEVEVFKAEDIPFEKGSGRATIVFETPFFDNGTIIHNFSEDELSEGGKIIDGMIDVIVLAKELKPSGNYEILLKGDSNQGVVFGPKENVEIRFGSMVGETLFQPNEQGELFVSMKNPLRVISNAEEIRVIVLEDGKEVLRTEPFIVSKK
ncbi:hypothetical protein [Bacillus sp. FJAT-27445]|uniref:hypothetical protein n=1 Tax=Bacillus sp. FJAT-27445 TaxID=1679166 RepID=UPI00074438DD|nr:hypothetical protein [Bacillus sp. FJAT-27445]